VRAKIPPSIFSTFGQHPDGSWGLAHTAEEASAMGFNAIHVDSMIWSIVTGLVFFVLFRIAAKNATPGVPGPLQNFVELIVDFIDDTTSTIFNYKNSLIAPMALTIFVWVWLMNFMDLVPVDWIPSLAAAMGVHYMKVVPSTDPNVTMAMAFSIFVLILYFSIKEKGLGGFVAVPGQSDTGGRDTHRQATFSGAQAVWEHVRGRDDFHSDCAAL
jgi:F-type H+-transporting ATPase subunit a